MYQTNPNMEGSTQKEFESLIDMFNQHITDSSKGAVDDTIWDLSKVYTPNHACIWNKVYGIGIECRIVEKNNQVALVQFREPAKEEHTFEIVNCIYRLEDLTPKPEEVEEVDEFGLTVLQNNIHDLVHENMKDIDGYNGVVIMDFPTDDEINKMGPDEAVQMVQSNTLTWLEVCNNAKKEN